MPATISGGCAPPARRSSLPRAKLVAARPMPTHAEKRVLPYSPEQLFALVADVERYPEFLPWCLGVRVREKTPETITADLLIGFKMVRERFTSKVKLDRPHRIDVAYTDGPFR